MSWVFIASHGYAKPTSKAATLSKASPTALSEMLDLISKLESAGLLVYCRSFKRGPVGEIEGNGLKYIVNEALGERPAVLVGMEYPPKEKPKVAAALKALKISRPTTNRKPGS